VWWGGRTLIVLVSGLRYHPLAPVGAGTRQSSLVLCALLLAVGRSGQAAPSSSYCREVHARAAGDAALLMSPQIMVQAVRFPSDGALDISESTGGHAQLRAELGFSPLDFYKGLRVLRLGDAECELHERARRAQDIL